MANNDIIKLNQNLVKRISNAIALTNKLLQTNKNEIKIFIANDHILFREGIKNILKKRSDIVIVGEADSFKEVYLKLKYIHTDILVTDDQMPLTDIFYDIKNIKKLYPELKIIMHTMGATEPDLPRYIQYINGYIEFFASEENYLEIFKRVHAGYNYFIKTETINGKFTTTDDREQFIKILENIRASVKSLK